MGKRGDDGVMDGKEGGISLMGNWRVRGGKAARKGFANSLNFHTISLDLYFGENDPFMLYEIQDFLIFFFFRDVTTF